MTRRLASLGALALLLTAVLGTPASALAADPTFGTAVAASKYGDGITVDQPATIPSGVTRVEAVVREGENAATFLASITLPGPGPTTLHYKLDTPAGTVYPNTPVELGFRLTFSDGHTLDSPTVTHLYLDDRYTWKTASGPLMRAHWTDGDAAFGQKLLDIGSTAIANATKLLGVQETAPIDFYIYADRNAFYDVIGKGLQENVGGLALPQIRTLFANIGAGEENAPWVSSVVPHELTHIVFDSATKNPYHEPLHWLNEGLAVYLSQGYDAGSKASVLEAGQSGNLMPLSALVQQFPASADRFSLAYDEAVSAIDFMVRTYGQAALVKLIRSYSTGLSDDAAFTAALGVDTKGFEAAWLADLGFPEPSPFGPQPAPIGPLPPGWSAAAGASYPPAGPTAGPSVANPAPTPDDGSGVVWLIVGIFAIVLVVGMVVIGRGLNKGNPLMPASGGGAPNPPPAPPEAWAAPEWMEPAGTSEPPRPPGPEEPGTP